jgi:plasmid replication initiation protein
MAKTTKKTKTMKQTKPSKKTATKRREWTKEDVRQLKTLAKQKAGVTKIARTLKRTPGATTVKAHILGVSLSMRD